MLNPTKSMQCPSNFQNSGLSHQKFGSPGLKEGLEPKELLDQIKYDYIVSAFDINTAEEVQSILINPPTDDRNTKLKNIYSNQDLPQISKPERCWTPQPKWTWWQTPYCSLAQDNALNDDPPNTKTRIVPGKPSFWYV